MQLEKVKPPGESYPCERSLQRVSEAQGCAVKVAKQLERDRRSSDGMEERDVDGRSESRSS